MTATTALRRRGPLQRFRRAALREPENQDSPHVTNMELFFDLVYVFAITQLSDYLAIHLSGRGVAQTLVLFMAVWWAWNYTAWATNWINPERTPVVVLMLALMAISLVMSAAIPAAFGGRGLAFAASYVAIQLVRGAFMVIAFGRQTMGRNYAQLLAWSAIAGAVWVAGAFLQGEERLLVWFVALVLDLTAPMHGFRLPGVRATAIEDWTLAGAHLAERMQLVLMIALGESVLRVGATFAAKRTSLGADASFLIAFVATASLWGVYFARHAEHGAEAIASSTEDAARLGRAAYAYAHAIMVAGVIVLAVAIRLLIEDPDGAVTLGPGAALLAGPGLYLAGLVLFKHSVGRGPVIPSIAGIALLALLGAASAMLDRIELAAGAAIVLVVLAVRAARRPAPLRDG